MTLRPLSLLALAFGLIMTGVSFGQSEPRESANSLQSRVDALAQQVHLRYRYHEPSLASQRGQIESVLAEWNRAQQAGVSAANQAQMADWLDRALRSAMPGGSGRLPATPQFTARMVVESSAPEVIDAISSAPLTRERMVVIEPDRTPPTIDSKKPPRPSKAEVVRTNRPTRRSVAKPVTEPQRLAPRPKRSKWSRHPAAAPLEWRDPFAADPAASANPLRSGTRHEARRPVFRSHATARVNRSHLTAEVRGYNEALRDLQLEVMNLGAGDVFGLAAAAEQLERLEQQREFIDLYREGISSAERGRLPASPSAQLVRELVRRKARDLALQTPPRRRAERRALEQLNDRLAGLDDGVQASR